MEKYKLRYLRRFLRRNGGIDLESCMSEMEKLKDEALKYYDDIEDLDRDILEKFSEMLLLDGCFVVEYIRERCGIKPEGEDKIVKTSCMSNLARRDILLLENQLPFFVLTKLHDMTKEVDQMPFIKIVKVNFLLSLPKVTPASFHEREGNDKEIKHLLQLLHMSCHPSEIKTTLTENTSMEAEHSRKSLCWNPLKILVWLKEVMSRDRDHLSGRKILPNATELSEAGINFAKVGEIYKTSHLKYHLKDRTSLFDIKFESGVMKIPCFQVVDDTETLLRNLIAYEQQSPEVHPTYFSDFAVFMDYLIDSDKDVSLLRQNGIINNRIGEDKEVASLFNKIGKGVSISDEFYYKEASKKAIQHCEQPWNKMKANLRHTYFNSPWAGISTVAAIILLLLTITQTGLSFISTL